MATLRTSMTMVLVSIMALALADCGFKLRGSLDISQELSPLFLQQNSVFELGRELKSILSTNNIDVAKDAGSANTKIILHDERMSSRVLSVDGSGQAREYLLSYTVNYSIVLKAQLSDQTVMQPSLDPGSTEKGGAEQQPKVDTLKLERTLLFQQDAVLAVANESEVLYQDMRRNAARMILLRLQARSKQTGARQAESVNPAAPSSGDDSGVGSEAAPDSEN